MEYLPLFLLFMAVLIAAYFYLERAKARPTSRPIEHHQADTAVSAAPPAAPPPAESDTSNVPPTDRTG